MRRILAVFVAITSLVGIAACTNGNVGNAPALPTASVTSTVRKPTAIRVFPATYDVPEVVRGTNGLVCGKYLYPTTITFTYGPSGAEVDVKDDLSDGSTVSGYATDGGVVVTILHQQTGYQVYPYAEVIVNDTMVADVPQSLMLAFLEEDYGPKKIEKLTFCGAGGM